MRNVGNASKKITATSWSMDEGKPRK